MNPHRFQLEMKRSSKVISSKFPVFGKEIEVAGGQVTDVVSPVGARSSFLCLCFLRAWPSRHPSTEPPGWSFAWSQ